MLVLCRQIEHDGPLVRDVSHRHPDNVAAHPAGGCGMRWPLWSGTVASCAWRAVRLRDSRAAYTRQPTVITLRRAMRRAGVVSESEDATQCGAWSKRHPRSAWAGPGSPASTAGADPWPASRAWPSCNHSAGGRAPDGP
jgi:hypothetical protein